ncbi:RNA polymerase sigma factor [Cellulomonas citrea]|uniref:RNA polymerase sigma factor n=1 Tax=Cellulomonas citrea TaxID=1909423 RepID=UPI001358751E|nr:sigma-70 family RNA polymerase sigma factor [Cellulomonas citrea]
MPDHEADAPAAPDGARSGTSGAARSGGPRPGEPQHDETWFTALVREHGPAVHRYLARRAGAEAEDLAAEVMAVAWRRRADVPDEAVLPWLYRTAGFVLANHRRKGRPVPVGDLPEEADLDDPALRAARDDEVRRALAALSARDRHVLLLNAWDGLVGEQLAEVLGVSRGGADAALSRARTRLRAAWDA